MRRLISLGLLTLSALVAACGAAGAGGDPPDGGGPGGGGASGQGGFGPQGKCGYCLDKSYVGCDEEGNPTEAEICDGGCADGKGCSPCSPGGKVCVGNEIHGCNDDGSVGATVQDCSTFAAMQCWGGECKPTCVVASDAASNVGCEFWAVDLDQQDGGGNDPASAPWGIVLSNAGQSEADVYVELNDAPVGQPLALKKIKQAKIAPGKLVQFELPTRELDCGKKPNDYKSPGTCLSSRAFRVVASSPIVVYQFNTFKNSFSNDASLLLPTNALGQYYRVIGWSAGHPVPTNFPGIGLIIDRSYVTIVGTEPGTKVRFSPTYKVKGNPPIAETQAGGIVEATIGPFDVLNLETADSTFQETQQKPYVADFTGSLVTASAPVAVFSGTESTAAPGHVKIPTYPGWDAGGQGNGCCLDHLEDQLFPMESIGKSYVITRSPVRSTSGYKEPDVLRFVGAAETAEVTTSLPAPFDKFTLKPGEVKDTWTQDDITVTATAPIMIGQILVSQGYVQGPNTGDPSLTVFPPVDQYRSEYVFLTPPSWTTNHVVISTEPSTQVTIDGTVPTDCVVTNIGTLGGKTYESRRCPLKEGAHQLSGTAPFGIIAYGYGSAGSYAFAGGADVKKIYVPPIPK